MTSYCKRVCLGEQEGFQSNVHVLYRNYLTANTVEKDKEQRLVLGELVRKRASTKARIPGDRVPASHHAGISRVIGVRIMSSSPFIGWRICMFASIWVPSISLQTRNYNCARESVLLPECKASHRTYSLVG
jgi:hypothetical protein